MVLSPAVAVVIEAAMVPVLVGIDLSLTCGCRMSGLGCPRRSPERPARIDSVRIERQHLVVERLSRCRLLHQPVEIADVLSGLFDDPGSVCSFGPLVRRDDGAGLE